MTKSNTCYFATVLYLIPQNVYRRPLKTGNGLAAGCQLFYRKIYRYFCSVALESVCLSMYLPVLLWGFRVVRWRWVSFQCRGVLLIWIRVRQGPTALAMGAGGGCLGIFTLVYHFSCLSPSLWETARYRLKNCLKGPLSPKQPTNQLSFR